MSDRGRRKAADPLLQQRAGLTNATPATTGVYDGYSHVPAAHLRLQVPE